MKARLLHFWKIGLFLSAVLLFGGTFSVLSAQDVNLNANNLLARSELSLSPSTGSFVEGSLFDIPIFLNTKGSSINGIQVRVDFDKNKLSIVKPLGGNSIIGVWVEPPAYDNTRGFATYVGVVPNGIKTGSGLVGTITFKAIATGSAVVTFHSDSKILLNDGLGTETALSLGRSVYNILPKSPEGVRIYSETHPFQENWYKNNNPILSWDRDPGVDGFSFVIDDKPTTIPGNVINESETTKSFESLADGLWYFHIKAHKNGVWGTTGNFLVRIDSTPPAQFTPEANYLLASPILIDRTLVSFFTTDNLSGVDHYEVGVIDKSQPVTVSPVFVESESPYQVPLVKDNTLTVIVRAIDKAGNIRDASIDVKPPLLITKFIKDNLVYILLFIILLGLVMLILHYLVGHHIIRVFRRAFKIAAKEERDADVATVRSAPVAPPMSPINQPRQNYGASRINDSFKV